MRNSDAKDLSYMEIPLLKPNTVEDRLYQRIIAYNATLRNTLVVLPTALGKTIISALVTLHLFRKYKDKRILIMAPTRPLVIQHRETYRRILKINPSNIVFLTGKVPASRRKEVWDGKARILFATPQVVENDLESGILSLRDFCLLVFDECHRARKDYAYTNIAKHYFKQCDWPLILGITASPGSSLEKIQEICDALYMEQIEYRCEDDEDVAPYINPVKVEWRTVDLPEEYKRISEIVRLMLKGKIEKLASYGLIHKDFNYITRKDLLELGEGLRKRLNEAYQGKGSIYSMIALQSASLTLFHLLELIETQGIKPAQQFLEKIDLNEKMSYRIIKNDPNYFALKDMLKKYSQIEHTKINELKKIVEEQLKNHPESRIIVFTQYRNTATQLVDIIKEIKAISVERFVGQASKYDDQGLTQQEQIRILEDFRNGSLNVLVATSIAEEGLDIPSVDLVVFYEPIPSEIRYIQRKGRTGRKRFGKAIILIAEDTSDIAYFYASRRKAEKMRRIVKTLNQKLNPVLRNGSMPTPNPLTEEEIKKIEELAELEEIEGEKALEKEPIKPKLKPLAKVEEEIFKPYGFKGRRLSISDEDAVEEYVYIKALEAGFDGKVIDELMEECMDMGFESSSVKKAINRLLERGRLSQLGFEKLFAKPLEEKENEVYLVEVLKIKPGEAEVLINDEQEAKILPGDFNAPLSVLKKYAKFKARGEFYKSKGCLNFRVSELIEILSN
ncbi:MAG: helicase-related protein [Candidatus Bathyarchaeia archaeon]